MGLWQVAANVSWSLRPKGRSLITFFSFWAIPFKFSFLGYPALENCSILGAQRHSCKFCQLFQRVILLRNNYLKYFNPIIIYDFLITLFLESNQYIYWLTIAKIEQSNPRGIKREGSSRRVYTSYWKFLPRAVARHYSVNEYAYAPIYNL